jgi:L-seryl-tRNA(Ser) seleniumtransferase
MAMAVDRQELLRSIPSVDVLVRDKSLDGYVRTVGRAATVAALRSAAARLRGEIASGTFQGDAAAIAERILSFARAELDALWRPFYRKAVNASGIILHTGLGRAVLAPLVIERIREHLSGYSLVQLEVESGKRSKRDGRIEELLVRLTGAEAATVVNNNAAATLLALNTTGAGREIIVSRGQLVEIGGEFRMPDVFAASGAKMVEVGTTNRTHPRDYENAITAETAAILRVHPSNYRIEGFVSEVPLETMVEIAHSHGLPLLDDVGAGALVDFSRFGFAKEPTLPESVAAGADVITSSGDKLIGASQAGIILGKADLVERIRKNPLWRALRVGKLTLAALEATLTLFLDEETALREVPTLRMAMRAAGDIGREARRIARAAHGAGCRADIEVVDGFSQMGSGSLPGQDLPTRLVSVRPHGMTVDDLAARLRGHEPPIFARVQHDALLLDPRTLQKGEAGIVAGALAEILAPRGGVDEVKAD